MIRRVRHADAILVPGDSPHAEALPNIIRNLSTLPVEFAIGMLSCAMPCKQLHHAAPLAICAGITRTGVQRQLGGLQDRLEPTAGRHLGSAIGRGLKPRGSMRVRMAVGIFPSTSPWTVIVWDLWGTGPSQSRLTWSAPGHPAASSWAYRRASVWHLCPTFCASEISLEPHSCQPPRQASMAACGLSTTTGRRITTTPPPMR